MASFGRRPAKGSADGKRHVAQQPTLGRAAGGSFRGMQEEEEERLQFKKEHQQRQEDKDEPAANSPLESKARHKGPNPKIFLEVEIRHKLTAKLQASGRLEFELFADKVPLTAENFRCLCTGEKARDLHYENCKFHSITPGVRACGGDITAGNGTGGRSIYGESFAPESCSLRHNAAGLLSMATLQSKTHNSQFYLMLGRAEHMDRKHVVFGKITSDDENMLKHIDKAGSKTESSNAMVSIVDCGEVGKSRPVRDRSRSPKAGARVPLDKDGRVEYGRLRSGRESGRRQ